MRRQGDARIQPGALDAAGCRHALHPTGVPATLVRYENHARKRKPRAVVFEQDNTCNKGHARGSEKRKKEKEKEKK